MPFIDYFKPDWKHTNMNIRLNSLNRIKNFDNYSKSQKIIEIIAINDPHKELREKAIQLLNPHKINDTFNKINYATHKELFLKVIEKTILTIMNRNLDTLNLDNIKPYLDIFKCEEHLVYLLKNTTNYKFQVYLINNIHEFKSLYELNLFKNKAKIDNIEYHKSYIKKTKLYKEFKQIQNFEIILKDYKKLLNKLLNLQKLKKTSSNQRNINNIKYQYKKKFKNINRKWTLLEKKFNFKHIESLYLKYYKVCDNINLEFEKIVETKKS